MSDPSTFGAIILAAGRSRRFGDSNKLLTDMGGLPMIRRTVDAAVGAGLGDIVVVTGEDGTSIDEALAGTPARTIANATPWAGMGTSLAVGANALESGLDGLFVVLGDMPMLKSTTYRSLIGGFGPGPGRDIVVPVHDERRGHPVLFAASYLSRLRALNGDVGARDILMKNPERVHAVTVDDPGTLLDIDTLEDLSKT